MTNAIEINNLYKSYQGFTLNNISFHVPQGICCGFVGANGAGKTTTLKAIMGMLNKDGGEISLLGRPDGDIQVKEEIGVMFDQPYFQEDWTPLDIERGIRPFYKHWNSKSYREYLIRFELDLHKKFKEYSRGMKMKLGMAVNLSHEAKLLLLDEPTGGLDPSARDELLDVMREYMVTEGRTILFSSHITSDLERIADHIVYISNGNIFFSGGKEDFVSRYCVVRGGKLPENKTPYAIGLRGYGVGYECLMKIEHIHGFPIDTVTEKASIDDIIVYLERGRKHALHD